MFRGFESLPAQNTKISDDDDAYVVPLVCVQAGLNHLIGHRLQVVNHLHPGDILVGHDVTEPVTGQDEELDLLKEDGLAEELEL